MEFRYLLFILCLIISRGLSFQLGSRIQQIQKFGGGKLQFQQRISKNSAAAYPNSIHNYPKEFVEPMRLEMRLAARTGKSFAARSNIDSYLITSTTPAFDITGRLSFPGYQKTC